MGEEKNWEMELNPVKNTLYTYMKLSKNKLFLKEGDVRHARIDIWSLHVPLVIAELVAGGKKGRTDLRPSAGKAGGGGGTILTLTWGILKAPVFPLCALLLTATQDL